MNIVWTDLARDPLMHSKSFRCCKNYLGIFGSVFASSILLASLAQTSLAQDRAPEIENRGDEGFFDKGKINEDFFKPSTSPNFGPLKSPPQVIEAVPPAQPPQVADPEPPQVSDDDPGLTDYDSQANSSASERDSAEQGEVADLKRKVFDSAQRDNSLNELFERTRMIKEQIGVSSPDPEDSEGESQPSKKSPSGASKKKTNSHRF